MSATAAVTVIVPGRDVAPYAQQAIDSLRAQTRTDWRAVLIDDGSRDGTDVLFLGAADVDPRFVVVTHAVARGLGAARNAALDLVDTPYLAFLDADDAARPTFLERTVGTLERSGSDVVVGAYVRLRPIGAPGDRAARYAAGEVQPWVLASTTPERIGTTLDDHPEVTGNIVAWSKVSRTDLWRRAGLRFPEGRLYEDQVLTQRLYVAAERIDVISDVLVEWRVRADGTSITQREHELPVLRDCLEQMLAGVDVLAAAHPAAAAARRGQILRMDIPRLAAIARDHADPTVRCVLGAFTDQIAAAGVPDDLDLSLISEVTAW